MINVQIPRIIGSARAQPPIWRPTAQTFWVLLALQGLALMAILLFVVSRLPVGMPLTQADAPQQVRDFLLAGDRAVDPLIEVAPGVIGRASSLRGLQLNDQTYYYYYEGRPSYDPLNRGVVTANQVELLLRDMDNQTSLVVYRIIDK